MKFEGNYGSEFNIIQKIQISPDALYLAAASEYGR